LGLLHGLVEKRDSTHRVVEEKSEDREKNLNHRSKFLEFKEKGEKKSL